MFKILVLSLLFWLSLCLTPLGDVLDKQIDSWAVKRVEKINQSKHVSYRKLPDTTPFKHHKW